MSATTDKHAKYIIEVAKTLPLSAKDQRRAAEVGVTAAIAESSLLMYANDGTSTDVKWGSRPPQQLTATERAIARQSMAFPHDKVGRNLDSMGLFQQRPGSGWGIPSELMNDAISANKFYKGAGYNKGLLDIKGWQNMGHGEAAQKVQGSPPHDRPLYDRSAALAIQYVNRLWGPEITNPPKPEPPKPKIKTYYQVLYGS